jgi:hypothetical protein
MGRLPTLKQKVAKYESLLHEIQACHVTDNCTRLLDLLDQIWNWSYAHRVGNGQLTSRQQRDRITEAFNKLGT